MRSWRPSLRSCCNSEKLEMPSSPSDHQFAVDQRGFRRQLGDRLGDGGKLLGPVEPAPRQQLDLAVVEPRLQAIAVELDLVDPVVAVAAPCRRAWRGRAATKAGRAARRDAALSCARIELFGPAQDRGSRGLRALAGRSWPPAFFLLALSLLFFGAPLAISSMERPILPSAVSAPECPCRAASRAAVVVRLDQQPVVALLAAAGGACAPDASGRAASRRRA